MRHRLLAVAPYGAPSVGTAGQPGGDSVRVAATPAYEQRRRDDKRLPARRGQHLQRVARDAIGLASRTEDRGGGFV